MLLEKEFLTIRLGARLETFIYLKQKGGELLFCSSFL